MIALNVPLIETERLHLRGPAFDDLDALAAFMGTERASFVGGPIGREETWRMLLRIAGHWHLRGYGLWFIEDKASGKLAGWVGILHHIEAPEPELAWSLFDGFEGKGIAHEAAKAARDHVAVHMGITAPFSMIDPANARSQALARRLGAEYERDGALNGKPMLIFRHLARAAA